MLVPVAVFALTVAVCLAIGLYVKTGMVRAAAGEILLVTTLRGHRRLAEAVIARGMILAERVRTTPFEVAIELTGTHAPLAKDRHPIDVRARLWLVCPTTVEDVELAARTFGAAGIGDPSVMQPVFGPLLEAAVVEVIALHPEAFVKDHEAELASRVADLLGLSQHGLRLDRCELSTGTLVADAVSEGPFR